MPAAAIIRGGGSLRMNGDPLTLNSMLLRRSRVDSQDPDTGEARLLAAVAAYVARPVQSRLPESNGDSLSEADAAWLASQPRADRDSLQDILDEQRRIQRLLSGAVASHPRVAPENLPGDVIDGEYRLISVLGSGGMGQVWEAEEISLTRLVALKLMRPGDLVEARDLSRLKTEALAGARLTHPGIVSVFRFRSDKSPWYIAMELVPGGRTLRSFIEDSRHQPVDTEVRVRTVCELFAQIADALNVAHEAGVTHRDIKPANILLTPEGEPRVADFGLARLSDLDGKTPRGAVPGSAGYWSPEVLLGGQVEADLRSDIFSLGATLFEVLTLEPAFSGERTQQVEGVLFRDPPLLRTRLRSAPLDLSHVVAKSLERDRERRYPTMESFAKDLRAAAAGDPVIARPMGRVRRVRRWIRRNPRVSVAVPLVILLAFLLPVVDRVLDERADAALLEDRVTLERWRDDVETAPLLDPARLDELDVLIRTGDQLVASRGLHEDRKERLQQALAGLGSLDVADPLDRARRRRRLRAAEDRLQDERDFLERLSTLQGDLVRLRREAIDLRASADRRSTLNYASTWESALESMQECPHYEGLSMNPQVGLMPLRQNPASKLWEFYVPLTGARPMFDSKSGEYAIGEDTAVVLVLVPGTTFAMGAKDDPWAESDESPQQTVVLEPYFLGKYEVTQAQFQRITGSNPSDYWQGLDDQSLPSHPVEHVGWDEARRCAQRLGMDLPTEAQWEWAARAELPTSSGVERTNLGERGTSALFCGCDGARDDGFDIHAPVDAMSPNGSGFYHLLGNVEEWCRDHYVPFANVEGMGLERVGGEAMMDLGFGFQSARAIRGGSFLECSHKARPTYRSSDFFDRGTWDRGFRLARAVDESAR